MMLLRVFLFSTIFCCTCVALHAQVDTIVVFQAKDSVRLSVTKKKMRLRGDADVQFKNQKLEAEIIDLDFNSSLMNANGVKDSSTGLGRGYPVFTDNGEEYAGEQMSYNFTTKKGKVTFGETNIAGGYYYGSAIKRIGEETAYIENGCFTTCDAPHPHFYFSSPKMKVIANEKIFLDPIIWYVEDIPVFALPVGLFFSAERGRRSGLLMPQPLFSSTRGVALTSLGYFFAISDYFQTEVTADITTKGGYTLYNKSAYRVGNSINGRLDLLYGYTRSGVTQPFSQNTQIIWEHQQSLRPDESISIRMNIASNQIYQNTSLNPFDRLKQNANTNASYQRTFYNGMTLNTGFVRDQNLITGSVSNQFRPSFRIPNIFPLKNLISGDSWLRDMMFSYGIDGEYSHSSSRSTDTGSFMITENSVIRHNPTLTLTPKLGYFNLSPTITYGENWHFTRLTQRFNALDSSIQTTKEQGFYRDYTYSAGINASTTLYGMAYPKVLGITALRHTLQPNIGITYVPDQSASELGFYGRFYNPRTNDSIVYARFTSIRASSQEQLNLSMNLQNRVSIKIAQDDTLPDKTLDLFTLDANTSYNVAADSLNLNPVNLNFRTPVLDAIGFNASATLDPYNVARVPDRITGDSVWRRVNQFAVSTGNGVGRLTRFTVQMNTQFSSSGVSFDRGTMIQDSIVADTVAQGSLRSRFERRVNYRDEGSDLFGDRTYGWSPVLIPWECALGLSYTYNNFSPDQQTEDIAINFRGSLSLTETLRCTLSGTYSPITGTLGAPIVTIDKQIHCWQLSLNWVAAGPGQMFFLRFGASAQQLKDLVIPKQSTPLYR